jgi:glycosyltransferase involved in cell wall biosynthesis
LKIKLLLYSHDWLPVVGGIQTVTLSLATGLAQWGNTHQGESIEVIFVTQTPANGMDDSALPFRVVRHPSLRQLIALFRWANIIDLAGPALVPLALSWILRKRTALEHHGYQSICPNGILVCEPAHAVCPGHFMARRYLECVRCNKKEMGLYGSVRSLLLTFPRRWLAKRVTVNVGVSPYVAQRVALPRTTTIWNGVPATNLVDAPILSPGWQPVCFAYLGRLVTEKGLPVLLRASRELLTSGRDFRLRIVGDGPERGNLENLAKGYGLSAHIEFLGSIPAHEVPQALQGVTALVMPSVCEDVAPLAAMEQMMAGRLLIGSDIGGLGLVVDGAGLKFPPGDASALASCMRQVLDDPSRAAEFGQSAHHRALQLFTQDRMVADHVRLYRGLCHHR